jgi:hypothetical protein
MKSSVKNSAKKEANKESKASGKESKISVEPGVVMPLGAVNYLFIALGALVIVLSYAGMYIEKSVDGFFALYISPFTLIGAYLWVLYSIFYRPKSNKKSGTPS